MYGHFLTVNREILILLYTHENCYRLVVDYRRRLYPNRLKVIRQNAGYAQQEVARLLGHDNSNALCAWEKEHTMPSGINLIKLCIIYGRTPRELYPEYYKRVIQELDGL
jgi:transcriptional regulator with XRE-family HTH domain